jgi:alanine racemase
LTTNFYKRIWAEIDLDAIAHNVKTIRSLLKDNVAMMAVVKADAYGHGVEAVTHTLVDAGVNFLAVSSISEGVQLRQYEHNLPILILGYTPPECATQLTKYRLTQTIYSLPYAEKLSAAATKANCEITGHIKLDVGMGRLGFRADNEASMQEAMSVCNLSGLLINGMFTHLPSADFDGDMNGEITKEQIQVFEKRIKQFEEMGYTFPYCHCCNSAATLTHPNGHMNLVREGIALYGLSPVEQKDCPVTLQPAMTLKTVVSMVKELLPGDSLSYGRTVILKEPKKVATVCIGYADGYPRNLSNKGYMLVNGKKATILGRVCMDQLMLDVTHIDNVEMGTEVTVFGQADGAYLPVEEVATLADTIHYELVCVLGKRVPRVYRKNGKTIGVTDYIREE